MHLILIALTWRGTASSSHVVSGKRSSGRSVKFFYAGSHSGLFLRPRQGDTRLCESFEICGTRLFHRAGRPYTRRDNRSRVHGRYHCFLGRVAVDKRSYHRGTPEESCGRVGTVTGVNQLRWRRSVKALPDQTRRKDSTPPGPTASLRNRCADACDVYRRQLRPPLREYIETLDPGISRVQEGLSGDCRPVIPLTAISTVAAMTGADARNSGNPCGRRNSLSVRLRLHRVPVRPKRQRVQMQK